MYNIVPLLFTSGFSVVDNDVPKVDYDRIMQRGATTIGTITGVTTQYNESINHVHPTVISYTCSVNGHIGESKFKNGC